MPGAITLEVFDAAGRRTGRHTFEGRMITVGTHPENDVVIADQHVSRRHARIDYAGDRLMFHDFSTNGSFVKGNRVAVHKIASGDEICLGSHRLRLFVPDAPAATLVMPSPVRAAAAPQPTSLPNQDRRIAATPPVPPDSILQAPVGFKKTFDVFQHPQGRVEAVKRGFSLSGFFLGVLLAFLFVVAAKQWPPAADLPYWMTMTAAAAAGLALGVKANELRRQALIRKGYSLAGSVDAITKQQAVAALVSQQQGGAAAASTAAAKKNWLYAPILSRSDAEAVVAGAAGWAIAMGVIAGVLAFVNPLSWIDAAAYVTLGAVLRWSKSRTAAVLLAVLSIAAIVFTVSNALGMGTSGGGKNIVLAVTAAIAAIRAVEATFKLHGRFANVGSAMASPQPAAKRLSPIVVFGGGFVMLLGLVGWALSTTSRPWKPYRGDAFTVQFPGEPKKTVQPVAGHPDMSTISLGASSAGTEMAIVYIDFPNDNFDREKAFHGARDSYASSFGSIEEETTTSFFGNEGRQLRFHGSKGPIAARMFFAGRRFYVLIVGGKGNPDAQTKFFDSFQVQ